MLKAAKNIPSNSQTLLADEGGMTGFTTIKIRWWQIYHTLFYIKKYVHWEISRDHMFCRFVASELVLALASVKDGRQEKFKSFGCSVCFLFQIFVMWFHYCLGEKKESSVFSFT